MVCQFDGIANAIANSIAVKTPFGNQYDDTCTVCHRYEYECVAASVIIAWIFADKFHSDTVWCPNGCECAAINSWNWRMPLSIVYICTALLRAYESVYEAEDPPSSWISTIERNKPKFYLFYYAWLSIKKTTHLFVQHWKTQWPTVGTGVKIIIWTVFKIFSIASLTMTSKIE